MSTKDLIKGLFKRKKQSENSLNTIEIDYREFNSDSIGSTFKYAVAKYGNIICHQPDRLKNILTDLSPRLIKEIKLLQYLCKSGRLNNVLELDNKDLADMFIWINNSISYLAGEEMIDEQIATEFCVRLICDIVERDVFGDYLNDKDKRIQEIKVYKLFNHAKELICVEEYAEAENLLTEVCEKAKKQDVVNEAILLLKQIPEIQLEKIVESVVSEIKEGRYKEAGNTLCIAKNILKRCDDSKKIKGITKQLSKFEDNIHNVIEKCFQKAEKEIKRKEFAKANMYINQVKNIAGEYFQINEVCSFWKQRIRIESLINDRSFGLAILDINIMKQNFGLEKKYAKYIYRIERKIRYYEITLVLLKILFLVLFMFILVVSLYYFPIKWNNIYALGVLWLALAVYIVTKSDRKKMLFGSVLFLMMDYMIWLLISYQLISLMDIVYTVLFSITLPLICGIFLTKNINEDENAKNILFNIGSIVGVIFIVIIMNLLKRMM